MIASETKKNYKFGLFRVDPVAKILWHGGDQVPLTPKVFHTLKLLLENRDRIVSKQELLEAIWPDTHVEEANLTQNISVLRKALGEPNSAEKYIETFPRRGYRFVANVSVEYDQERVLEQGLVSPVSTQDRTRPTRRSTWIWGSIVFAASLAALSAAIWSRLSSPMIRLETERVVTHLPGRELQPAVSPDGSRIAFTYHGQSSGVLRVGLLDYRNDVEPTFISSPEEDAYSPAWSPDGKSLAYLQNRAGRVFVMVFRDGQPARQVAEVSGNRPMHYERQMDWSTDGLWLAISIQPSPVEPYRIELVHASGSGERTPLTVAHALSDGDFEPRFSPDGKKLAFIRVISRVSMDIYIVNLPGATPEPVTSVRSVFGSVDWSPDSKSLIFSEGRDGRARIWTLSLRDLKRSWIPTTATAPWPIQFSVSRQTGSVIAATGRPDLNVWKGRIVSEGMAHWDRWITSTASEWFPTLSPDGRRTAFLSDRDGKQQIWIRENDGKEWPLTPGDLFPNYPTWTADGRKVIFSSLRERQMYAIGLGDRTAVKIPIEGAVGGHVAAVPDASSVLLVRRFYLMEAPFAGGNPTLLTESGGFPLRASPDGEWVYYSRHRYSDEVWRVQRSSHRTERITDRLLPGCWGCWAVNGKQVVYITSGTAQQGLLLESIDLATRQKKIFGRLPGRLPPMGTGSLSVAEEGSSVLAVVSEPGNGELSLMTPIGRN